MQFCGILIVLLNTILLSTSRPESNDLSVESPKQDKIVAYYTEAPEVYPKSEKMEGQFIIMEGPLVGNEGCEVFASCIVNITDQKHDIEWITPTDTDDRREETTKRVLGFGYVHFLKIKNATYNDTGFYQCKVKLEQGEEKTVEKFIKVKPILRVEPIVQQTKEKIELKVHINKYDSRFQYQWLTVPDYKNVVEVHESEKYKMHFEENSATLTINNFTDNDEVYYGFREYYTKAHVKFNITAVQHGYNIYYSATNECGWDGETPRKLEDIKFYSFIPA